MVVAVASALQLGVSRRECIFLAAAGTSATVTGAAYAEPPATKQPASSGPEMSDLARQFARSTPTVDPRSHGAAAIKRPAANYEQRR